MAIYLTLCPARPVMWTFVQYLIAFCNRLESASKCCHIGQVCEADCHREVCEISCSLLKPFSRNCTQSRRQRYFRVFRYNLRPKVDNNDISSVAADYVRVKFDYSRSNGCRNIWVADFVSIKRMNRSLSHKSLMWSWNGGHATRWPTILYSTTA